MKFIKVELKEMSNHDWHDLDSYQDRVNFQRLEWLNYIASFTHGEIILAKLYEGTQHLGYFSGILFKKMGIAILGSPVTGWTTGYMGFNLKPHVSRQQALSALIHFAFDDLHCLQLHVTDKLLSLEDGKSLGMNYRLSPTFISDLTLPREVRFKLLKSSSCQGPIRKAEKSGIVIEKAEPEGFAKIYYSQLVEVFARQHLKPTYSLERVEKLIEHVYPSGNLLLVSARAKDNNIIATGIFTAFNDRAFFWGNASSQQQRYLSPNEAIHWFAMNYWQERGIKSYDWSGISYFKEKFGGKYEEIPVFHISKYKTLDWGYQTLRTAYYKSRSYKTAFTSKLLGK